MASRQYQDDRGLAGGSLFGGGEPHSRRDLTGSHARNSADNLWKTFLLEHQYPVRTGLRADNGYQQYDDFQNIRGIRLVDSLTPEACRDIMCNSRLCES